MGNMKGETLETHPILGKCSLTVSSPGCLKSILKQTGWEKFEVLNVVEISSLRLMKFLI